jgi:hypothetical protein
MWLEPPGSDHAHHQLAQAKLVKGNDGGQVMPPNALWTMHSVDTTTLGPRPSRTFMIDSLKSICLLSRPATSSSAPRKKIGHGPIFSPTA